MGPATRQRLLDISARFYERHGTSFDASRDHPWPGWHQLWELIRTGLPDPVRCLDAGCGNGRFGLFLHQHRPRFRYLGLDLDPGLVDAARRDLACVEHAAVRCQDLIAGDLAAVADAASQDLLVLFGVLHHVPDEQARHALLRGLAERVTPGGWLAATVWRLDRDTPRFERKRIPWREWNERQPVDARVDVSDLEAGDVLLGWRGDREVPRYCHFPGDDEIERLADLGAAWRLAGRFEADGPSGRDNLYLVWRRANLPAP